MAVSARLLALLLCLPLACNAVLGIEERGGKPGGQGGQGVVACADGSGICASPPPLGWNGPIVLSDGELGQGCSGDWGEVVATVLSDIEGEPASCSCSCSDPVGSSCPSSALVEIYTDDSCASSTIYASSVDSCVFGFSPPLDAANSLRATSPQPTAGSCTPVDAVVVPDLSMRQRLLCGRTPGDLGHCVGDDEVCLSLPGAGFEPRLCVWSDEHVPCPGGDFVVPMPVFDSFEDNRGCTPCTCGPSEGDSCPTSVTGYAATFCFSAKATGDGDVCVPIVPGGLASLNVSITAVAGTQCPVLGGEPDGEAIGIGQLTVCCTVAL